MIYLCSRAGSGRHLEKPGYCHTCRRKKERDRSRRRRRTPAERYRRQSVVEDWVAQHGWICPGYECEPHESHDLTADHVQPVGRGGAESGPLRVLCRSCNSARGRGSIADQQPEPPLPRLPRDIPARNPTAGPRMKVCRHCGESKPTRDFPANRRVKDGLRRLVPAPSQRGEREMESGASRGDLRIWQAATQGR